MDKIEIFVVYPYGHNCNICRLPIILTFIIIIFVVYLYGHNCNISRLPVLPVWLLNCTELTASTSNPSSCKRRRHIKQIILRRDWPDVLC